MTSNHRSYRLFIPSRYWFGLHDATTKDAKIQAWCSCYFSISNNLGRCILTKFCQIANQTEQKMLSSRATPMTSTLPRQSYCVPSLQPLLLSPGKSSKIRTCQKLLHRRYLLYKNNLEVFDKTWAFCIVESAPERVTESPTRKIARRESFIWKLGWDPSFPNHSQAFKFKGVMLRCWDDIAMLCVVSMFALFPVHSIAALNQIVKIYEVRQSRVAMDLLKAHRSKFNLSGRMVTLKLVALTVKLRPSANSIKMHCCQQRECRKLLPVS